MLAANGLERRPARVKILLSRGVVPGLGLPEAGRPTLVIWAQPYAPPPPAEYAAGWPVVVFPERRSSFIGRHKSLNYLFYLAARQYALDRGAREAVILEADGLVSEGSATSLVYLQQGKYFTPAAASALPGVTVAALSRGLEPPRPFLGGGAHHLGTAPEGRRRLAGQRPHGPDAGGRHRRPENSPFPRVRIPAENPMG